MESTCQWSAPSVSSGGGLGGGAVLCSVADDSQVARLALSVQDYACSNAIYGTNAACSEHGGMWAPMHECSQDYSPPCMVHL